MPEVRQNPSDMLNVTGIRFDNNNELQFRVFTMRRDSFRMNNWGYADSSQGGDGNDWFFMENAEIIGFIRFIWQEARNKFRREGLERNALLGQFNSVLKKEAGAIAQAVDTSNNEKLHIALSSAAARLYPQLKPIMDKYHYRQLATPGQAKREIINQVRAYIKS